MIYSILRNEAKGQNSERHKKPVSMGSQHSARQPAPTLRCE
jgi:hypothetical protein